jgi:hypothetical protein
VLVFIACPSSNWSRFEKLKVKLKTKAEKMKIEPQGKLLVICSKLLPGQPNNRKPIVIRLVLPRKPGARHNVIGICELNPILVIN